MQIDLQTLTEALWRDGYLINKAAKTTEIQQFIDRFRENYVSTKLQRIGAKHDGGYLIPMICDEIDYCFSPGVDVNSSFEQHLSDLYHIKSFLADASVSAPPIENENFIFEKKFLGSKDDGTIMKLSTWVDKYASSNDNLMLQMDIEGAEIDVLVVESANTLQRFKCMVIEFHFLDRLFEPLFLRTFRSIFDKIFEGFQVVHVHPNNAGKIISRDGISIPTLIECTFLRKDLISKCFNEDAIVLPHLLDNPCGPDMPDIQMPKEWWIQ